MLAALVSISGFALTEDEKRWLNKNQPLGVSLFARNIKNKKQLIRLTDSIREVVGHREIIIGIDQEGGRVRRLHEPEFSALASQYVLGKLPTEATEYHSSLAAKDLREVGINMNYSPVLDVCYPTTHPVLKSRCFGSDECKVAGLGRVMIENYMENGICPCFKHMPGHGRAEIDPHLGLPILNYSLKELEKDFLPFMANNDCPAGMTAHIVISEVDSLPVTASRKAIDTLIRGMIGFDGLLISDAIDMKALKGTVGEKAKTCIEAGCDVICYCSGKFEELEQLAENCPNLSDKALERFEKIRNVFQNPLQYFDNAQKYYELTGNIEEYNESYDATEVLHLMK